MAKVMEWLDRIPTIAFIAITVLGVGGAVIGNVDWRRAMAWLRWFLMIWFSIGILLSVSSVVFDVVFPDETAMEWSERIGRLVACFVEGLTVLYLWFSQPRPDSVRRPIVRPPPRTGEPKVDYD